MVIKEYSRKLVCLALAHMLTDPATQAALLASFGLVLNAFVSMVHQFHCRQGAFTTIDYFVRPPSPPNELHISQPEYERIKQVGCVCVRVAMMVRLMAWWR